MTCKYIGVLDPDLILEIRGKLLATVLPSIRCSQGKSITKTKCRSCGRESRIMT